ncbi:MULTISPECIES: hypothetical protein [unclassified Vibrio]|uniref:hypothetical protein n=1 Tax=unclassified Vibrio TaxID=2614977 RepID=UPI000C849A0F|nr:MULTISPECIES: hypothetical protein [unclassified Vibrio]PMK74866.1 hypothetical protein BCT92_23760 [Vibrio sp. 10N.261.52.E5]TKF77999.1 hypothetical protein FCV65_24080 [Vibrio sp. F13]
MTKFTYVVDPKASPEEQLEQFKQAQQEADAHNKRIEAVEKQISTVFKLESPEEIKIAVDLLLPFITKNVAQADTKLLSRLSVRIDTDESPKKSESSSPKSKKYRILSIEHLEAKAPNLYKYLVDVEGFKPLEADPTFLVVAKKRMKNPANDASEKDGLGRAAAALEQFVQGEKVLEANSTIDPTKLPKTDFEMP